MTLIASARRDLFCCSAAFVLGWIYGYPLESLVAALIGIVIFWLYQMQRVQRWLQEPERPPPDIWGMWGELLARMYLHQRKSREVHTQLQLNV